MLTGKPFVLAPAILALAIGSDNAVDSRAGTGGYLANPIEIHMKSARVAHSGPNMA